MLAHPGQLAFEGLHGGHGAGRVALQAGRAQQVLAVPPVEVGQQDLPARRRVQGRELAHPVVRGDGGGPAHLVEVDRVVRPQDGDVHRLADLLGESAADGPAALCHIHPHVHPHGDAVGEADEAEAEAILAAVLGLLDQPARLQRAEQAERGRLVHLDLGRELGDPGLPAPGEDLHDADRPVHGLHAAAGGLGPGGGSVVAHSRDCSASPGTARDHDDTICTKPPLLVGPRTGRE